MNKPKNYRVKVIRQESVAHDVTELVCQFPEPVQAKPGQYGFFDMGPEFLLRRAFSIGQKHSSSTYSFFIKVKGKASSKVMDTQLKELDVLFPLGNGFQTTTGKKILLIGGGCGFFPLISLGQELFKSNKLSVLFGARKDNEIILTERLSGIEFITCTEEGKSHTKGLVTDFLPDVGQYDMIYACGPEPMLKALYKVLPKEKSYYSLEEKFACGYGICLGCSIKTNKGMKRVCKEGPVFSGTELYYET